MTTLEKIRAEIEQIKPYDLPCDKRTPENIRDMALSIIDKYAEQAEIQADYDRQKASGMTDEEWEYGKLEQEPKSVCDLCRFDYMDGVCGDCPAMTKAEWER